MNEQTNEWINGMNKWMNTWINEQNTNFIPLYNTSYENGIKKGSLFGL